MLRKGHSQHKHRNNQNSALENLYWRAIIAPPRRPVLGKLYSPLHDPLNRLKDNGEKKTASIKPKLFCHIIGMNKKPSRRDCSVSRPH